MLSPKNLQLTFMVNAADTIDWPLVLEQNRSWLTNILRARIGDRHDVEDVYQEIVLAVLKQVKRSFGPVSAANSSAALPTVPLDQEKIAPWLYRIAIRHVVNFYRRTNRLSHAKPSAELDPASQRAQPLDWMLAVEKQNQLQGALEQLRPQDREVLTLKYQENWSYQQIADQLGVPVRNIEYRLLSARKRLRQILLNANVETSDVSIRLANQ